MKKLHTTALLGLGLALGLQGCAAETNQQLSPSPTEAPHGLQTTKFILDDVP